MRKSSLCTTIFWVALGVFVSAYAYIKLGIGKFNAPGPGLMPFLLGVLFGLLALYKLVMTLLGHGESEEPPKEVDEADQSPTTFLTMVFLFRSAGFKRWSIAAASSAGVVLITYFLFTYLGVRFPPGVLRALGLN
jgi:hypothetical protein